MNVKLTKKITSVFLIILLVCSTASTAMPSIPSVSADENSAISNTGNLTDLQKAKFDSGFYESILGKINTLQQLQLSDSATDSDTYHNVIFIVNKTSIDDSSDVAAQKNKDLLESMLTNQYGATNIYKAKKLSFVTADVPVYNIPQLSTLNAITNIGDGQIPLSVDYPVVLSSDSVAEKAHSYTQYDIHWRPGFDDVSFPYDGTGINIASIDSGISQVLADLPIGSTIVKQTRCDPYFCSATNLGDSSFDGHGTRIAGIIASQNPLMIGISPNANLFNGKIGIQNTGSELQSAAIRTLDWAVDNNSNVITNSFGNHFCDFDSSSSSFNMVFDEAVDLNVVVIIAADNEGLTG